jgi:tellurite resistance protein TehA-like permease
MNTQEKICFGSMILFILLCLLSGASLVNLGIWPIGAHLALWGFTFLVGLSVCVQLLYAD